MKKNSTPAADLIPAAAYIRMSDDKQEMSPEQQRIELPKLAEKHGCRIIEWYVDEAMKGDNPDRPGFKRMIADAEARRFRVILAFDQDRFSRFDPMEFNYYCHILRIAGVKIITEAQGELDLETFAGWITASINQHAKHQYLKDLARNCMRAVNQQSERGEWHSRPLYGFDRCYFENGKLKQRAKSGESKPSPTLFCKLEPSEDEAILENVRWMFETFCDNAVSLSWLTREMRKRAGTRWTVHNIKGMLSNVAYIGDTQYGGRVKERERFGRLNKLTKTGTHTGLIDPEVFQKVQERLASIKMGARVRNPDSEQGYLLSGVLRCGCCGGRMCGKKLSPQRGKRSRQRNYRYYICRASIRSNGEPTCQGRMVPADLVEGKVMALIQEHILEPDNLTKLRAAIVKAAKAKASPKEATRQDNVRKQIEKLDRMIERGVERILELDAEDVPAANAKLKEWRRKREELRGDLSIATAPSVDVDALVARAAGFIQDVRKGLQRGKPMAQREVIRRLVKAFTVYWHKPEQFGRGKRQRHRLSQGVIDLTTEGGELSLMCHNGGGLGRGPVCAPAPHFASHRFHGFLRFFLEPKTAPLWQRCQTFAPGSLPPQTSRRPPRAASPRRHPLIITSAHINTI